MRKQRRSSCCLSPAHAPAITRDPASWRGCPAVPHGCCSAQPSPAPWGAPAPGARQGNVMGDTDTEGSRENHSMPRCRVLALILSVKKCPGHGPVPRHCPSALPCCWGRPFSVGLATFSCPTLNITNSPIQPEHLS